MTWKRPTIAALAACLAFAATPASADEPILPQTQPLALDPTDPDNKVIGELTYRGGLEIEPGEEEIGGITSIEWHDGQLYAVTDDGRWLIMTPDAFRDQLVDMIEIEFGELRDERGKKLRRGENADATSLARTASGEWLVSFDGERRLARYQALGEDALPGTTALDGLPDEAIPTNLLSALALRGDGWFSCAPRPAVSSPNCLRSASGVLAALSIDAPSPLAEVGGIPSDVDCASNGVCYVLLRSQRPEQVDGTVIVAIGPDGNRETLASWTAPLSIGDFKGLTVREEGPKTYLYIVSDNGLSDDQRNKLMKFEVSARAASAPGVPEKVFETTTVVLETSMGEITVALETERAPITAANFLRYIDEDRFDDTRCYRAMHVKGGEEPAGFLQCGTQNHPDRILDPIAHEPTNETGLNHTDGALSMARFDPGTATGDFSIMIRDQPGLDAQPDAEDPALRPGFAVFGYVTDGMDVVHAIHATRIDPDKGEGFLKGQMLAEPVTIVNVRRAAAE